MVVTTLVGIELDQELLDLIAGVKSGGHEEFEILKAKYMPLISDMAKSFEESGAGSLDDLMEDAERAFLKAAVNFDDKKEGITFGLYAKICIRNALISVRRAQKARLRKQERVAGEVALQRSRALASFGDADTNEILRRIESSLSEYEMAVLKEFFSGRSAKETAEILDTDEKSVYNAVYRIRVKAKSLGNED